MGVKEELIAGIKKRLELTVECGFPEHHIGEFLEGLEDFTEEQFLNFRDMNYICNRGIFAFEACRSCADDFDCMSPNEWNYYLSLQRRRHGLSRMEENEYMNFLIVKRNCAGALGFRSVHAHEARVPLWEHHDAMDGELKGLFQEHIDLGYRYRQILYNPFWSDYEYYRVYHEKMGTENVEKLMDRILRWFTEQPEDYLIKNCRHPFNSRLVGLAFSRSGRKKEAKRFLGLSFQQARELRNTDMQERLLIDMKQAGIKRHIMDIARVKMAQSMRYG
jgi:hypothetical protein